MLRVAEETMLEEVNHHQEVTNKAIAQVEHYKPALVSVLQTKMVLTFPPV